MPRTPNLVERRQFDACIYHLLKVPHAVIAHADAAHKALSLALHSRLPAVRTFLRAANRAMDEVEVNVVEAALLQRRAERGLRRAVPAVAHQLRGEEDGVARRARGGAEVADRAPALCFVVVPLRGVL